jgi:hypothetical protein
MIDKTKTPILISTPRAGSHYVGQYIRETFKNFGMLTPRSSELFNEGELPDGLRLNDIIHFFEYARDNLGYDILTIAHASHLSEPIRMLSRPQYEKLFDWFKEFYDGYKIVILRRKKLYKQWLSYLFHKSIDFAQRQSGATFKLNMPEDVHPWHNLAGTRRENMLMSTIAALNPKFIHRENLFQKFLFDIRFMEEEIRNYYIKGPYLNSNILDLWLENLNDDKLIEWFVPLERQNGFVMQEAILPFKNLKIEVYFKKEELDKTKSRFMEYYEKEFKHYGYVVD